MTTTTLYTLMAIGFSAICLAVLAISDQKRHRRCHNSCIRLSPLIRRGIAVASLLPLIVLPVLGSYTGLLSWLGAIGLAGWFFAVLPPERL